MSYRSLACVALSLVLLAFGERQRPRSTGGSQGQERRQDCREAPARRNAHIEHATEEEHRTEEEFQWRQNRKLGWATLVIASIAVGVSTWTLIETRRQANDSHENLILSSIPYVYTGTPSFEIDPSNDSNGYVVVSTIGNAGGTPTKLMTLREGCAADSKTIEVLYKSIITKATIHSYQISPKVENRLSICNLTLPEVKLIASNQLPLVLGGKAVYQDLVSKHAFHMTQFCYQLKITQNKDGTFGSSGNECDHHNCTDGACPDYGPFDHELAHG